jgi:hypothetical protein
MTSISEQVDGSIVKIVVRTAAIIGVTASVVAGYMQILGSIDRLNDKIDSVAGDVLEIKSNHLVHVQANIDKLIASDKQQDLAIQKILTLLKQ